MPKSYPPGLIGLASGELSRFSNFTPSLLGLQKPAGTMFKSTNGLGPAAPFNDIARYFLSQPHLEWLFLTNDDHTYPADAIPRLLDADKDIVTGLYLSRFMSFPPILFDKVTFDSPDHPGMWFERKLLTPADQGLIRVEACGDGCLMIQRRVIDKLLPPWWEYGLTAADLCDHDMFFSWKATQAGFEVWCDLNVRVGHTSVVSVVPAWDPESGEWVTQLIQTGGDEGRVIVLPAATKKTK